MTSKEIAVREQGEILERRPQDVVDMASAQAKLLMNIVEQTKCYQEISGKKYLQVEAWETIGAFNRVHAETENITPIKDGENVIGYQAKVQLWKDGQIVGGASMPCFFTENCCKGKEGDAKHKACMSAAQTFATSKAYRMNYSYVAILAGYQPTPAEEMTGESVDDRPANLEHWCEKHQTKWFKRGKMKGYAHPIGDTGEWCNEEVKQETPPEAVESKSSVGNGESKGKVQRDLATITNIEKLAKALKEDFGLSYQEQWEILGIDSWNSMAISPQEAYLKVVELKDVAPEDDIPF